MPDDKNYLQIKIDRNGTLLEIVGVKNGNPDPGGMIQAPANYDLGGCSFGTKTITQSPNDPNCYTYTVGGQSYTYCW